MRQSLHHLIAKAPWNDDVLLERVRNYVLPALEKHGPVVAGIVDDTGFSKKGKHSVGGARQYYHLLLGEQADQIFCDDRRHR